MGMLGARMDMLCSKEQGQPLSLYTVQAGMGMAHIPLSWALTTAL